MLQSISAQINQGDKIGIIGSNGIGKTTLVRIIGGDEIADAGTIQCNLDNPIIVYLPQKPYFQQGSIFNKNNYK